MDQINNNLLTVIKDRAENLFVTKQLMCADTVLTVLNNGLGGGLSSDVILRLTSGFPDGLGGAGCTCGAVSGGVLALGLFLGGRGPGQMGRKHVMFTARKLHDLFKDCYGSICCKVLIKKIPCGSRQHFKHCAKLTGTATEMAGRLILEMKPELVHHVDWTFLSKRDGNLLRIVNGIAS